MIPDHVAHSMGVGKIEGSFWAWRSVEGYYWMALDLHFWGCIWCIVGRFVFSE
jgi:hypothetical protein